MTQFEANLRKATQPAEGELWILLWQSGCEATSPGFGFRRWLTDVGKSHTWGALISSLAMPDVFSFNERFC